MSVGVCWLSSLTSVLLIPLLLLFRLLSKCGNLGKVLPWPSEFLFKRFLYHSMNLLFSYGLELSTSKV